MLFKILGWAGMLVITGNYLLLYAKVVDDERTQYHLNNFLGAVLIIISVIPDQTWHVIGLQVVWCIIAIISFYKNAFKPRPTPQQELSADELHNMNGALIQDVQHRLVLNSLHVRPVDGYEIHVGNQGRLVITLYLEGTLVPERITRPEGTHS